ncbi:MAG: Lpg1974 family pore-forming outer membrane protein [Chlamydiia bacterium]
MNIRSVLQLPVLLATLGLVAGTYDEKKNMAPECAPLCYAGPMLECDNNWDVMGAAVLEQVNVQGAEVALLTDRGKAQFPQNAETIQQPESFWWGFKVGLGYKDWTDNWKTSVRYNYFKAISNSTLQTSYGQQFIASEYANQYVAYGASNPTYGFENLQAGTYTLINNLNFLLGRPTLITPNLELTTSYGVTATWMTRRQLSVFTNDTTLAGNGQPVNYSSQLGAFFQNYQKYSWWGVGPMVSFHSNWYLGNNVGIYADAYGAVTYGQSNVRNSTFSRRTVAPGSISGGYSATEAVLNNSLYQFSPEANFQLGLNWSNLFREDTVKVEFQIGYETAYYFQVMKTPLPNIIYNLANGSGIGIQGLVLQGSVDF